MHGDLNACVERVGPGLDRRSRIHSSAPSEHPPSRISRRPVGKQYPTTAIAEPLSACSSPRRDRQSCVSTAVCHRRGHENYHRKIFQKQGHFVVPLGIALQIGYFQFREGSREPKHVCGAHSSGVERKSWGKREEEGNRHGTCIQIAHEGNASIPATSNNPPCTLQAPYKKFQHARYSMKGGQSARRGSHTQTAHNTHTSPRSPRRQLAGASQQPSLQL